MSTLPGRDDQSPEPARAQRPNQRLGRSQRIVKPAVFREAYEQGRHYAGKCMVMWLRAGEGASLRLGVVASRKTGNAAARNRARRRLREVFRLNRHRCGGPWDVILVARRRLLETGWPAIVQEFTDLARQGGILVAETPGPEPGSLATGVRPGEHGIC